MSRETDSADIEAIDRIQRIADSMGWKTFNFAPSENMMEFTMQGPSGTDKGDITIRIRPSRSLLKHSTDDQLQGLLRRQIDEAIKYLTGGAQ